MYDAFDEILKLSRVLWFVLDVSVLDILEYLVQNYALYLYLMCQYLST